MRVETTELNGVIKVTPPTIFEDFRGTYIETYNRDLYREHCVDVDFKQDDISRSRKNVLRGIHGDQSTWKLVSCLYGKCISIIVNNDRKSKLFGKYEKFILSPNNYFQILIPPKHGNSFFVTSEYAIYHYKQTKYYSGQKKQFTINVKDPLFKIKFPHKKLIISARDQKAKYLS